MSSHFYLLRKSIKNSLLELKRKPGKLIMYIIVVAVIVGSMWASMFGATHTTAIVPTANFAPIFFAFLMIFYVMAIQKGLSSGDAIFDMSDVNLMFVSPVNPRTTLLYGLIKLVGTTFWAGFFLMFQGSNLADFGIGAGGTFILFGVFMLTAMALTILSLVIYSKTNGNPRRKLIVKILACAALLPLVAELLMRFAQLRDPAAVFNAMAGAKTLFITPIVGWSTAGAMALIQGDVIPGLLWLLLLVLSGVGMVIYIMYSNLDYYEDVLVATETAFEKKRAQQDGNVQQTIGGAAGKVKVGSTGIRGMGASTFLFKHLRETFRQNRLGFLSAFVMITGGSLIAGAFIFPEYVDALTILQILAWIQVFMIGTGRGMLELYSPYLYMIPASPTKKLIWSNMELMARIAVESVLFILVPCAIAGEHPLITAVAMLAYILFSLLVLGINLLSMRWTGANLTGGLLIMVYMLAVLLIAAPGVVGGIVVGMRFEEFAGALVGMSIFAGWCFIAAMICFYLSRGILNNSDMPTAK